MLIAIAGRTVDSKGRMCNMGSGKSTVANTLIEKFGFVQVGLADPMRRFCQEVYQFSDNQIWGPSEYRNAPDKRYPGPPTTSTKKGSAGAVVPRTSILSAT